jgi:aspartyl protease family protein
VSDDTAPRALYLALLLLVIGSSIVARRMPLGQTAKMGAAWAAIFAAAFVLFAFRGEFSGLWERLRSEVLGEQRAGRRELRISMANDGHFWVNADINGQQVRFLIDSGASITTVSRTTADQAGLETGMRVEQVETANGTVLMRKGRAERLIVGPIERQDIGVNVNGSDSTNVLGMNFLSSLTRWSVEGRSLVMVS